MGDSQAGAAPQTSHIPPIALFSALEQQLGKRGGFDEAAEIVAQSLHGVNVRDARFDPAVERPAAARLARRRADFVCLAPVLLHHWLVAAQRWPANYASDLFRIKRCVADALAPQISQNHTEPASATQGHRVVVMVPWIPANPNNNILRVVAGYVAGLRKEPNVADACLLVTNEVALPGHTAKGSIRADASSGRRIHEQVLQEFGVPADALQYAAPLLSEEGNAASMRRLIDAFGPTCVFVPNFELTAAYAHGFGRRCATVYLQTSIRNRPAYDFTRYLYLGAPRQVAPDHIHPERWHYHPFGYEPFGFGAGIARSDLGLSEDQIVLVTAGNRLEREISPEFAEVVANAKRSEPRLAWLLLGVKFEEELLDRLGGARATLEDSLVMKSYALNIGDIFQVCDLYVNPPRTGGAVSMAVSVYADTPVLSFTGNDAETFLLADMAQSDSSAYARRLEQLVADPLELQRTAQAQRTRMEQHHRCHASAQDLVQHIQAAWEEQTGA